MKTIFKTYLLLLEMFKEKVHPGAGPESFVVGSEEFENATISQCKSDLCFLGCPLKKFESCPGKVNF